MIRLLARSALVFSLLLTVGCGDDDDPSGPGTPTVLTSGVPVTGISGGGNASQKLYRISVTSGATRLLITTSSTAAGDVDLYVKRGTPPTLTSIDDDCDSENEDNNEVCDLPSPAAGEWYILLVGYAAYSGVTLTATVTRP